MKFTNFEMSKHLISLNQISNKVTGKLGYAVAKNIRKFSEEIIEFDNIRNSYICEHGVKDDAGNYSIPTNTKEYDDFLIYIEEYAKIENDVDIFMVDSEELYSSSLTASDILNLEFMIKE